MAIIEYLEGGHPGGLVGLRVVTTLGLNEEYRQAYFSYKDYKPGTARDLAETLNEQWRHQASIQRQENWLSRPTARAGEGWLASGFRSDLLREHKTRRGKRRMYYAPAFLVDKWPRYGEGNHRCFRVNVPNGIPLDKAYHAAVKHYAAKRNLDTQEYAELLSRQPSPQVFVQFAIKLALKDYAIDINAIRRRVGVPEL